MNSALEAVPDALLEEFQVLREEFSRFMFAYKFGMDEVTTKVSILQQEFKHLQKYNPIEHVTSRLKTPESVLDKIARKQCEPRFEEIRAKITDIAGVRITCSFTSDVYPISDALTRQDDLTVLQLKDYVAEPKPNGYRSLHLIVRIPVFLSDRVEHVKVEVQLRTIAMDFWATLEHKLFYKYFDSPPADFVDELMSSAMIAAQLDERMESLHRRIHQDDH